MKLNDLDLSPLTSQYEGQALTSKSDLHAPSHVLPVVGVGCRVSLAQAHAFFMFLSASSLGMGFYAIYQNKVHIDGSSKDRIIPPYVLYISKICLTR